jgi:hypothetical protein
MKSFSVCETKSERKHSGQYIFYGLGNRPLICGRKGDKSINSSTFEKSRLAIL